jgi:lysophospholipid acyltransferase (LPLAT)-like uncharacterized protein
MNRHGQDKAFAEGISSQELAFTRWQLAQIRFMQYFGFCLVSIGRTMRWESAGDHHLEEARRAGKRVIFAFWHNRIITSTWYWRGRGIAAMTSLSFDGEYIARVLGMFGYSAVRGSSSRDGLSALYQMDRLLAEGRDVAFTVDGPRGPVYRAKPGPVMLAKRTGCPIFCFHISASRYLRLRNWDGFQAPVPFSRALVLQAPPIWVPADAGQEAMLAKQQEMQQALDRLRAEGDAHWRRNRTLICR